MQNLREENYTFKSYETSIQPVVTGNNETTKKAGEDEKHIESESHDIETVKSQPLESSSGMILFLRHTMLYLTELFLCSTVVCRKVFERPYSSAASSGEGDIELSNIGMNSF